MVSSRIATVLLCTFALLSYAAGYSVSGNKILDPNGNTVLLRGVDRCSFEWNPNGEQASANDYMLMAGWGSNVVRIALNQDFWLSGSSTYSSGYQNTIDQQVQWARAAGMGVILDLHWSDMGNLYISSAAQQNMADSNSITFWTQVATKYKNNPWVIFELYNEPHDVSWSVWRNGGSAAGFTVAGMQQLYNAVRATGANNVVIVNGLNYAFDLSGVASNAITGTNIAYGTHPYDYAGKQAANWDAAFGYLAATYPVIMTEFGQYCSTDGYVAALLAYAQTKGIHWTAWAWYVSGCEFPSIISDWSGTPTATGAIVKSYLSTHAATAAPTSVPTPKPATAAPTLSATAAPTSHPATAAPTLAATAAPTSHPATAAPTTQPVSGTIAPTSRPTATAAPTTRPATAAPTTAATSCTTSCTASCIQVAQTLSSYWPSGTNTIYQYGVTITNKCTTKSLSALTLTASSWNPAEFWGVSTSSNLISLSGSIAAGASSTQFGYQNYGGMATFAVTSFTFA